MLCYIVIIRQYKSNDFLRNNNDLSIIPSAQDFLGGGADDLATMVNFDLDFDLHNNNNNNNNNYNNKNFQIEKAINLYYEKINIKQMFIDSLPISQKNTNNSSIIITSIRPNHFTF